MPASERLPLIWSSSIAVVRFQIEELKAQLAAARASGGVGATGALSAVSVR